MRSNFSAFILAFALIAFSGVPAFAASIQYLYRTADSKGNVVSQTRTATKYTQVTSTTKNWQDSNWYCAMGKISMNSKVTVSWDVHLILKKGCTLTAT